MEKEEYLYMIINEIEKAKRLKEDNVNKKEFYQKIESKDEIKDFDNNIEYANKTIDSLENIIYLPVYEIIKKMSNNTLMNYKKNILNKIVSEISNEYKIIDDLKKEIIEIKNNIESISSAYTKYKKENTVSEYDLNTYIKISKDNVIKIDNLNKEIKEHENIISDLKTKKNTFETKTLEEIREYLINLYNLKNIENELEKYKVNRSDEIIVNLCKDLNVLDNIESLIKEYINLNNEVVRKKIEIPQIFIDDCKIKNKSIKEYILNDCIYSYNRSNEIIITDEKDLNIMKNNIVSVKDHIKSNKNKLIEFKVKLEEFVKIPFGYINKELVEFISNLCNTLYLTELEKNNVKELYIKYTKLVNKKSKTEYSVNKSLRIEKELMYLIRDILDVYWGVLCEELESIINNFKNNAEFVDNIYNYNIHKGKNKVLFDINNFSEMGLLNMRILIENTLSQLSELINELHSFSNDLSYYEGSIKSKINDNNKKLKDIKSKIDVEYYKISPNDFPILIEDYNNLNKIFKEKTLIDSIVKINRKDLISKVRSESVNYRDKENLLKEDMEVIKKKVLNK